MKLFSCQVCHNVLYFENVVCTRCNSQLGFLPDSQTLTALHSPQNGLWQAADSNKHYRQCRNYAVEGVCNWMVEEGSDQPFCLSCRLNRTIPDLSVMGNKNLWQRLETQKRRLVYSLLRMALPVVPLMQSSSWPAGLAFDFLADTAPTFSERGRVMTGHNDGVITLNIAEADDAERVRMREQMDEPYRTMLGHFRHESGHYYWDRLVRDTSWLAAFRGLFGDETLDYSAALERHYQQGAQANWQQYFVSAYASSHPWEDWAETWAHYLHIVDTLETAYYFGVRVQPLQGGGNETGQGVDAYQVADFEQLIEQWLPLTFALNSLNRSMGHGDLYPFVLPPPVLEKLAFVHAVVKSQCLN